MAKPAGAAVLLAQEVDAEPAWIGHERVERNGSELRGGRYVEREVDRPQRREVARDVGGQWSRRELE